jgi:3-mercaptopyruvate sulfurtransferase SseA
MLALVARAALILLGGAALGLLVNRAHPRPARFDGQAAGAVTCAAPEGAGAGMTGGVPAAAVEVVPFAQVSGLCGDPRVLVADARSAQRFAEGHVAGAIHLPCSSSEGAAAAALGKLDGKETLIIYGEGTEDALPVADEMRRRLSAARAGPGSGTGAASGVRVAVMEGGFTAWNQAGLACSAGPCADCGQPAHPEHPPRPEPR